MNWNKRWLALTIIVFFGITILSLLPPKSGMEIQSNDKINHFIAYAVLSLNLGFVVKRVKTYLFCIPLLFAYGLLLEYFQGFVPGRQPSWLDALANSIGVVIGLIIFWIYFRLNSRN